MRSLISSDSILEAVKGGMDIEQAIKTTNSRFVRELDNNLVMKKHLIKKYEDFLQFIDLGTTLEYFSYIEDSSFKEIFVLKNNSIVVATPYIDIDKTGVYTGWSGEYDGRGLIWEIDGKSITSRDYDVVTVIEEIMIKDKNE